MASVLKKIAAYKREEVRQLKARYSERDIKQKALSTATPKGFAKTIEAAAQTGPALIAEIKKASPSKGVIRANFDPVKIAQSYKNGGATCLSVLTDEPSFLGSTEYLSKVRKAVDLPLLRKDFLLDPMQVYESRLLGADAILIIMAMVDDKTAKQLMISGEEMSLDSLVEVHNKTELQRALGLGAKLIGINNRDLNTFETSLETFKQLAPTVPANITLVAESGIYTSQDILELAASGAKAYLVGESLMRKANIQQATETLLGRRP